MSSAAVLTKSDDRTWRYYLISTLQIIAASLFIGLCAQIQTHLPFTPVPLSGQTFAIMLVGATMGSRKGLLSVIAYLMEGSLGMPVFVNGAFGVMRLLGTNGGYFVGFLLQAYLVGWCIERQKTFSSLRTSAILLSSCALQVGLGALWLSHFVGLENAFMMGVAPFIIGEIVKSLSLTAYLKSQNAKSTDLSRSRG